MCVFVFVSVCVGGGWSAEAGMLVYEDERNNALSHQEV